VADDVHWNLDLDPGTGRTIRLAGGPSAAGIRLAAGGQEVTTYLTPFGNFSAIQRSCRLVVRQMSWTAADRLTFRGDYPDTAAMPYRFTSGSHPLTPVATPSGGCGNGTARR